MSRITPAWAGYSGVRLNMAAVKRERAEMYEKGLHCLGFWHTHPELRPAPSHDDIRLAKEHAEAGKSDFEGLVFAIVGTDSFPVGLGVWVHDGTNMWRAESEILGAGKGFT
ncbi:Mov34/MPN/PAD-1 family protein [Pseudomonas yamanorum]|uniref:Mov34/MPN/PAD-1 family protein n=1 Tax=Pseudomonas yamanorum TaxID=515393 RepID=UPI0034E41B20